MNQDDEFMDLDDEINSPEFQELLKKDKSDYSHVDWLDNTGMTIEYYGR